MLRVRHTRRATRHRGVVWNCVARLNEPASWRARSAVVGRRTTGDPPAADSTVPPNSRQLFKNAAIYPGRLVGDFFAALILLLASSLLICRTFSIMMVTIGTLRLPFFIPVSTVLISSTVSMPATTLPKTA